MLEVGDQRRFTIGSATTQMIIGVRHGPTSVQRSRHMAVAAHILAMASFTSDLFSFDLYVKLMTYVWSALAILAVALISQWPGLRAIRNVNIPQIVKERSE